MTTKQKGLLIAKLETYLEEANTLKSSLEWYYAMLQAKYDEKILTGWIQVVRFADKVYFSQPASLTPILLNIEDSSQVFRTLVGTGTTGFRKELPGTLTDSLTIVSRLVWKTQSPGMLFAVGTNAAESFLGVGLHWNGSGSICLEGSGGTYARTAANTLLPGRISDLAIETGSTLSQCKVFLDGVLKPFTALNDGAFQVSEGDLSVYSFLNGGYCGKSLILSVELFDAVSQEGLRLPVESPGEMDGYIQSWQADNFRWVELDFIEGKDTIEQVQLSRGICYGILG